MRFFVYREDFSKVLDKSLVENMFDSRWIARNASTFSPLPICSVTMPFPTRLEVSKANPVLTVSVTSQSSSIDRLWKKWCLLPESMNAMSVFLGGRADDRTFALGYGPETTPWSLIWWLIRVEVSKFVYDLRNQSLFLVVDVFLITPSVTGSPLASLATPNTLMVFLARACRAYHSQQFFKW